MVLTQMHGCCHTRIHTHLHELCDEEHAAHLKAGPIKLHNVAVVQLGQCLHLLQEQLQLLAAGCLSLRERV